MNTKVRLKKKRALYSEPKKPKEGKTKYSTEVLASTSDRYHYFSNNEYDDEEDNDDDEKEIAPSRQSISLKEINELLKKEKISPENVYFTVSLSDDYIVLEVVNIQKLSYKEQITEYEEEKAEWEKQQKAQQKAELQRIKNDMECLQKRSKELTKKKK